MKLHITDLAKRDGWACWYCGQPLREMPWPSDGKAFYVGGFRFFTGFLPAQIEHKIPRSRGGPDTLENCVLACGLCNRRKGTKTADEYLYEFYCWSQEHHVVLQLLHRLWDDAWRYADILLDD